MTEETIIWLVLEMADGLAIIGVFDSEDAARRACITPAHVMGPLGLNVDYNSVDEWWPGAVYPVKAHKGDPCVYCGLPHDEVLVGNCAGITHVDKGA